jgi:hypothetical protein
LVFPGTQDFILGFGIAALQAAREDALLADSSTAEIECHEES